MVSDHDLGRARPGVGVDPSLLKSLNARFSAIFPLFLREISLSPFKLAPALRPRTYVHHELTYYMSIIPRHSSPRPFVKCQFGRLSAGFDRLGAGFGNLSAGFAEKFGKIKISRKGSPSCALNNTK